MDMAGMFLSRMKNSPPQHQQKATKKLSPAPIKPKCDKTKTAHPGTSVLLLPDHAATVAKFENLRTKLLRQLVLYQKELLALKMPTLPEQSNINRNKHTLKNPKVKNEVKGKRTKNMIINSNNYINNGFKKWEQIPNSRPLFERKCMPVKRKLKSHTNKYSKLIRNENNCKSQLQEQSIENVFRGTKSNIITNNIPHTLTNKICKPECNSYQQTSKCCITRSKKDHDKTKIPLFNKNAINKQPQLEKNIYKHPIRKVSTLNKNLNTGLLKKEMKAQTQQSSRIIHYQVKDPHVEQQYLQCV